MGDKASVGRYELQDNALLKAIRPGGILFDYVDKGAVEVICVPQQSFLVSSGIAPYLLLPPLSPTDTAHGSPTLEIDGNSYAVTLEQHQQVANIIRESFLDYHLVHFNGVASPEFVTLRGQRGEFSANLQSVSRYGRMGVSDVLCDLNPILPYDDTSVDSWHPCKLHIFIVAKPLMDEEELHNTLAALRRTIPVREAPFVAEQPSLSSQAQRGETTQEPNGSGETSSSRERIASYRRAVASDNDIQFKEFQEMMKLAICTPVAKTLSNFVESVQQRDGTLYDNTDVRRATSFCLDQCRRISLFSKNPWRLQIAAEGFEKYVMTKLYWRAFNVDPEEKRRNNELNEKLQELSPRVKAEELDAVKGVEDHASWSQVMLDLEAMNFFNSPREKLRCSFRACEGLAKIVTDVLSMNVKNSVDTSNSKSAMKDPVACGADEFLPCFMLLVLRAAPKDYYSNVQFVKRFRNVNLINPEENYCLANLESAAEFWLSYTADASSRPTLSNCLASPPPPPAAATASSKFAIEDLFTTFEVQTPRVKAVKEEEVVSSRSPQTVMVSGTLSPFSLNQEDFDVLRHVEQGGVNVKKLLTDEKKAFDNLTVTELRAIVEEARSMLAKK